MGLFFAEERKNMQVILTPTNLCEREALGGAVVACSATDLCGIAGIVGNKRRRGQPIRGRLSLDCQRRLHLGVPELSFSEVGPGLGKSHHGGRAVRMFD